MVMRRRLWLAWLVLAAVPAAAGPQADWSRGARLIATVPGGFRAFREDGRLASTEDHDGESSRVWILPSVSPAYAVTGDQPCFQARGRLLATRLYYPDTHRAEALLWNAGTGQAVCQLPGTFFGVVRDGTRAITLAHDEGPVRLWEIPSGRHLADVDGTGPEAGPCFLPDDRWFVTNLAHGHRVGVWSSTTGKLVARLQGYYGEGGPWLSPDGRRLITWTPGGKEQTLVWDVPKGRLLRRIRGSAHDFSPDGRWIAAQARDSKVRLWNVDTGRLGATLQGTGPGGGALPAYFSPVGRTIGTETPDHRTRLWEVPSGRLRCVVAGSFPDYSPDGSLVLTNGHFPQPTRLSRVSGGRQLAGFGAMRPSFSPDGRSVILEGQDQVQLWDVATRRVVATMPGGWGGFAPSMLMLATDNKEGTSFWAPAP
ncbi:MAG: hypothetical protein HYU66_20185 [Armatimonadetes bacterium]|nr:hypothetical protein [Armatimonadota bacterium]